MNIREDSAGCVTDSHIEKRGFKIFDVTQVNDMGQGAYDLPQYQNDKVQIIGGYWNYIVKDIKTGKEIWEGWWNSNEEFDETMNKLGAFSE